MRVTSEQGAGGELRTQWTLQGGRCQGGETRGNISFLSGCGFAFLPPLLLLFPVSRERTGSFLSDD